MNWKLSEIQNADQVSQYYDVLYHIQTMNKLYELDLVNRIKAEALPNSKILDLGCGTGTLLRLLSQDYSVIGLDISRDMLLYTSSPAIQADGERMPFKDGCFNAVICSQTLHHYPELKRVLNEVYRVLDKDGKVAYERFKEASIRMAEEERKRNPKAASKGFFESFKEASIRAYEADQRQRGGPNMSSIISPATIRRMTPKSGRYKKQRKQPPYNPWMI